MSSLADETKRGKNSANAIYGQVLSSPWQGMTDEELEFCAALKNERLPAPKAFWTPEIYSLGRWIREYAFYPKILPLFVSSDHGVNLHGNHYANEEKWNSRVHLTWNPDLEIAADKYGKKIYCIPHPYLECIARRQIKPADDARGTLVFYSHSLPGFKLVKDTEDYFDKLADFPQANQPLVVCLHIHDIDAGNHRNLRKYGLPLVTAGDTSSIYFADRLLTIISKFKYSTSPGWGSHVAFSVKLRTSFFFMGPAPQYINVSHNKHPKGQLVHSNQKFEEARSKAFSLFQHRADSVTREQAEFIDYYLGVSSKRGRMEVSLILWKEFFLNVRLWWPGFIKPYLRKVKQLFDFV